MVDNDSYPILGRVVKGKHLERRSNRWVYVIGSPVVRPVKIGVSDDPEERLDDLQTGSPVPLVLLWQVHGGQRLESLLHERFAASRMHGEWFDLGDTDPVLAVAEEAARLGYGPLPVIPLPRKPITPTPRPAGRVKPDTVRGRLLDALTDGPATPRDLAHRIGAYRGAVYRPLERLVTQGHVEWLPDGRVTRIEAPTVDPVKKVSSESTEERVLRIVQNGPARQKDIAERTGLSKGAVSKVVARLVAAGRLVRLDDGALTTARTEATA
jgi:DNA-binding MarR family transcriptional regulator